MRKLLPFFAALSAVALMGAGCKDVLVGPPTDQGDGTMVGSQEEAHENTQAELHENENSEEHGDEEGNLQTKTVTLKEQNDSGESGTLVLTTENGKTRAVLTINGEPAGSSQPAHIHTGACESIGAVLYPLNLVVNGTSTTLLNIPIATILESTTDLSVNVHKSETDIGTYVACGDIDS